MGGAMLSKSLIQFSVDGRGHVPSLLFDLKPNYGGGNENNSTSFRRSHACTAALSAPNPAAGHHDPRLCRDSWTLPGKSGSVSCKGPCSFLLGPGAHKVLFMCSKSLFFPVLCKVWQLYGGVNGTSSKRAYAIPKSTVSRAPVPVYGPNRSIRY